MEPMPPLWPSPSAPTVLASNYGPVARRCAPAVKEFFFYHRAFKCHNGFREKICSLNSTCVNRCFAAACASAPVSCVQKVHTSTIDVIDAYGHRRLFNVPLRVNEFVLFVGAKRHFKREKNANKLRTSWKLLIKKKRLV